MATLVKIIGLSLPLLLCSCYKVGPDFSSPPAPMQSEWTIAEESSCDAPDRWWHLLEDETLNHLILTALCQNLSLQKAAWRIEEARAILGIRIGEYYPQEQTLNGYAFRVHRSKNSPNSFCEDLKYYVYNLSFFINWELDFWGRYRRGIEAATNELYAECDIYDDVMLLLIGDIAALYTGIRTEQEHYGTVLENIKIQKGSYEDSISRANGNECDLDLLQSRALLERTESLLPEIDDAIRHYVNALAVLLGTTPSELHWLIEQTDCLPRTPSSLCTGVPSKLLWRRPDIKRALHAAAAQSARIGIAKADLFPHIALTGLIGLDSSGDVMRTYSGSGGYLFSANSFSFFGGPQFIWPVLNYGRLTNKVRAEAALFEQLLYQYQQTVLIAQKEVEDALSLFTYAKREIVRLEKALDDVRRGVAIARERYRNGDVDYARVFENELLLLDISEQLIKARGRQLLGLVNSYKALGGSW